jgi:hypothetical protein
LKPASLGFQTRGFRCAARTPDGAPITVAPAASRFPLVAASGALPRNSLACTATGGASAVSTSRKEKFPPRMSSEISNQVHFRLLAEK